MGELEENIKFIDEFFNEIIFSAMIGDIKKGIDAKANYLAALGLCAYTEHLGGFISGNLGKLHCSRSSFKAFLNEMGADYSKNEDLMDNIYDCVRCGLVHEYFIKPTRPGGKSGMVAIRGHSSEEGFPDTISVIWRDENGKIFFFVWNYLRDFEKAVGNYYIRLVKNKDERLIINFMKSIDNIIKLRL